MDLAKIPDRFSQASSLALAMAPGFLQSLKAGVRFIKKASIHLQAKAKVPSPSPRMRVALFKIFWGPFFGKYWEDSVITARFFMGHI